MNKKVLIGLGILAVAGIGFYLYNKNKSTQNNEIDWKKTDAEIAKEFGLDLEQVVEMRKKIEGKSNAIGNPISGISFKKGKVILNNASEGKYKKYDGLKPVNTPAQFSGAIGRVGLRGVGLSMGNIQNQLNCSPDCGTIDCTRRGQASKCCKPCETTPTSTTTVSSFNGYINPIYNNLTLLVDPANA